MRKTAYALLLAALTAPFGVHAKYNPPKDVPQVSYAQKIAIGEINRLDKDRDGASKSGRVRRQSRHLYPHRREKRAPGQKKRHLPDARPAV